MLRVVGEEAVPNGRRRRRSSSSGRRGSGCSGGGGCHGAELSVGVAAEACGGGDEEHGNGEGPEGLEAAVAVGVVAVRGQPRESHRQQLTDQ